MLLPVLWISILLQADATPAPGHIEGRFLIGERAAAGVSVFLQGPDIDEERSYRTREAKTDAEGRFAFRGIPPGQARLGQVIEGSDGQTRYFFQGTTVAVLVRTGATTRLALGGTGRPVVGEVDLGRLEPGIARDSLRISIVPEAPPISGPPDVTGKQFEAYGSWCNSPAGQGRIQRAIHTDAAGRFRIEGVLPGRYQLRIDRPGGRSKDPAERGSLTIGGRPFEMPATPDGHSTEPLNLGRILVRGSIPIRHGPGDRQP